MTVNETMYMNVSNLFLNVAFYYAIIFDEMWLKDRTFLCFQVYLFKKCECNIIHYIAFEIGMHFFFFFEKRHFPELS